MSTKTIKICDYPVSGGVCGKEGVVSVNVSLGTKKGASDVCPTHETDVAKAFESIGLPFTSAKASGSKIRRLDKTKSGNTFTTADARQWLVEKGLIEKGAKGRIAKDLMKQYADAH